MKFYNIILFASLILCILSQDDNVEDLPGDKVVEDPCEKKDPASSKEDCFNLKTNKYKCCYTKVKSNEGEAAFCTSVSKSEYDNIKDYIKSWEEEDKSGNLDVKKLDCKSIYLEISVLSFILLLL